MALTTEPVVSRRRGLRHILVGPSVGLDHGPADSLDTRVQPEPAVDGVQAAAGPQVRGWRRRYAVRLLVTDFLALLLASAGVHLIRFPAVTSDGAVEQFYLPYIAMTAVLLVAWMLALPWFGSRDPNTAGYGAVEYKRII